MICDKCLHADVCGAEGAYEEALTYCANFLGWISVEEATPPIGTICLWCNKQGSVFTSEITYRSEYFSYVGKHGHFSNGLENYGDIVAWMPLPKPYKGESEGKG